MAAMSRSTVPKPKRGKLVRWESDCRWKELALS